MTTTFHAEAEIAAPSERVWAILADLERYRDWNPFTPRIDSDRIEGHWLVLHVELGGRRLRRQRELLSRWAPGEELRWGARIGPPWLFYADRWQKVDRLGPERCRYRTGERFEGALAPLIGRLYGAKVQRGFESVAEGLKRHAEALERAAKQT